MIYKEDTYGNDLSDSESEETYLALAMLLKKLKDLTQESYLLFSGPDGEGRMKKGASFDREEPFYHSISFSPDTERNIEDYLNGDDILFYDSLSYREYTFENYQSLKSRVK